MNRVLATGCSGKDMGRKLMRYTVILERDEDGMLVAHVPALRGCVSQGKNKRKAMKNVKEAIALYIETLIEKGQPLPDKAR